MATTGTVEVDFGAFPGSTNASVTVTGQASIAAGSLVEAWIRPVATTDHSVMDHIIDPPDVVAADIVAGTGFTIYGKTNNNVRHWGKYTVAWVWN